MDCFANDILKQLSFNEIFFVFRFTFYWDWVDWQNVNKDYDNGLVQEAFIQCWLRSVTQPGHSELTFLVKEATHVKLRTKMLLAASSARGRKWWQQTMTSIPGYTCGNAKVCGTFPCYRKKEALYINMIWKPGILLRLILKPLFLLRHSMPVFKRSGTSRYHLIYGNQILKSSGLNK